MAFSPDASGYVGRDIVIRSTLNWWLSRHLRLVFQVPITKMEHKDVRVNAVGRGREP